jgi:mono/diheme cytochrome c family protein
MAGRLLILICVLVMTAGACGGGDDSADADGAATAPVAVGPADVGNGKSVFESTCRACHGPGGEGITGLGKPMPGSPFITASSDDELISFLEEGRDASHPDNTTGVDMPPLGGNENLSEQDLVDVVAYMRSL